MKRKVRKYVEGGYGDDDYERNENREGRLSTLDPSDIEDAIRGRQMADADQGTRVQPVPMRQPIQSTNIGESEEPGTAGFSRTPLKSAAKPAVKPAAKPTPKPATQPAGQMGRTAMGKTAEQEMAAIAAGRQAAAKADLERRKSYDKPLEGVYPEAALIGGPGLKALRALGSGAGSKAAAQAAKPRVEPRIPQEAAKASAKKPDADYYYGAKSPKMAEKPGAMTTKPPRGGGKDPNARRPTRDELDEMRMGSDYMRKGGKVGSASRRADGIATRGKTRGRYI